VLALFLENCCYARVGVGNDKQRQDSSRSGTNNESAVGVQMLVFRFSVPMFRTLGSTETRDV